MPAADSAPVQARRWLIGGRVQGVAFRAHTQGRALALGLHGYAMNLADGRVEVYACGAPQALDELAHWLRHGPPTARVDEVLESAADVQQGPLRGFAVR